MKPIGRNTGINQSGLSGFGLQQTQVGLPPGLRGNEETIKVMAKLATARANADASGPLIRDVALAIVRESGCEDHDFACEARAVGTWVQKNVHYAKDTAGQELLIDPLTMLDLIRAGEGAGDCDDHALLVATLLIAIGIKPFFRAIRFSDKSGPYDHIYVVAYETDAQGALQRIPLDCIVKDHPMGYELEHKTGKEYPALAAR